LCPRVGWLKFPSLVLVNCPAGTERFSGSLVSTATLEAQDLFTPYGKNDGERDVLGVVTLWAAYSARAVNSPPTDLICATVPVWNVTNDSTIVLRRPDSQVSQCMNQCYPEA